MIYHISGIRLDRKNEKLCYKLYPVEFEKADREKILHGVIFCVVLNKNGRILRIKRSRNNYLYPGYNCLPAGHIDYGSSIRVTALKELKEETGLTLITSKRIFQDKIFVDEFGHFAFVYLFVVDEKSKPVFDTHEINPKESGFEYIEETMERLNGEKFTPLSRMILLEFIKRFSSTRKIKEYIKKIQNNIE